MQHVRFLHTSDWQLETPVGGVSDVPADLREPLIDAPFLAAERVVQAALDHQVDFVVLAGDILPIEFASPYCFEFLLRQFQKLADQEIHVYWAGGLIDDLDLWPAQLDLPKNVHCFPVGTLKTLDHHRDGKRVARLIGQSMRKGVNWRASEYSGADDQAVRIAVAYGEVQKRTLETKGVDYWALGGQHQHRVLMHGKSTAAYSGSPQGRTPEQTDAHGAVLVELQFGQAKTTLLETDLWRWRRERIQAADLDSLETLQSQLLRQLTQVTVDSARFGWLIVWSVICHGTLAEKLNRTEAQSQLLKALRQASTNDSRWTMRIEAEPAELSVALYEEDTVLGDFLRAVQRLEQDPEAWQQLVPFLPDTELREVLLLEMQRSSPEQRRQLWRRVAAWGADLLRGDAVVEASTAS
jgi:DNA repair exonuclease SbcCD nuclease subunit